MVNIRGSTPWTSTTIRAVLDSLYGRSQERYILYTNQYCVRTGINDFGLKVFMDARRLVTPKEGDRYPLGPPEQTISKDIQRL